MRASYMDKLKRVLALALAVVIIPLTMSDSVTTLVNAEEGYTISSYTSSAAISISSGNKIAQLYTSSGNYEQLTGASFKVNLSGLSTGATASYTVYVYQNLTNTSNPTTGVLRYTSDSTAITATNGNTAEVTVALPTGDNAIYLSSGETATIVIEFTLSNSSDSISVYEASSGTGNFTKAYTYSGSSWYGSSDACMSIIASGTGDTTIADIDSSNITITVDGEAHSTSASIIKDYNDGAFTIAASFTPALKRTITYSAVKGDGTVISVGGSTGKVTPQGTGEATICVSVGDTSVYVDVYILKASVSSSASLVYTGSELTPDLTVQVSSSTTYTVPYSGNASSNDGSSYFEVKSYSSNIEAGTATATIEGRSSTTYEGYKTTVSFTISQADIEDYSSNFTDDKIVINGSTITVGTNGKLDADGTILTQGTDFTVSVENSTATAASGTAYVLLITGINNYTGSFTVDKTVAASSANLVNINDVISVSWTGTGSYEYTGEAITPEYSITVLDGTTFDSSYYTVEYDTAIDANTDDSYYTFTITGVEDKGYTGTITLKFYITQKSMKSSDVGFSFDKDSTGVFSVDNGDGSSSYYVVLPDDGSVLSPTPTVTYNKTKVDSTNYSIKYTGVNAEIGAMYIQVTGKNNFTDTKTITVYIIGNLSTQAHVVVGKSTVVSATSSGKYASSYTTTYTGAAQSPSVTIYFNDSTDTLTLGTDYLLEYTSNTDAGQAVIKVTGLNEYAGYNAEITFTIEALSLASTGVFTFALTSDYTEKTYSGYAQTLSDDEYTITWTNGEDKLTTLVRGNSNDFTVEYVNNVNAGTATIIATGVNNYQGQISLSYTINRLDISSANEDVTIEFASSYQYTGEAIEAEPLVTYTVNGKTFTMGTDFTVTYANNTDVGEATALIAGTGNLQGTRVMSFNIVAKNADSLTFYVAGSEVSCTKTLIENYYQSSYSTTYNKSRKTVSVTVWDGSKLLTSGTDYEVSFRNNINASEEAEIVINGLGNYEAVQDLVIYFTIEPKNISSSDITVVNNSTDTTNLTGTDAEGNTYAYPSLAIMYGDTQLNEETTDDYTISPTVSSYSAGTDREVVITGTGNYTGTRTVTYTQGTDISTLQTFSVSSEYSVPSGLSTPYIGEDRYMIITLNDANYYGKTDENTSIVLQVGTDLDIDYVGDDVYGFDAGATITANMTGTGLYYYGSTSKEYTVTQADISTGIGTVKDAESYGFYVKDLINDVTYATGSTIEISTPYDGTAVDFMESIELYYSLKDGTEILLEAGTDFTFSATAPEATNAGSYTVILTGKGNYKNTVTITFEITQVSIEDETRFTISSIEDQVYTGSYIYPSFTVTDTELENEITTYDVAFSNNKDVGTATIEITAKGNYTGSRTISFNIVKESLSNDNVDFLNVSDATYTGSAITQAGLAVMFNESTQLVLGQDYTVEYSNNTNPGTATITITGIGNYEGSASTTFVISANINECTISNISAGKDYILTTINGEVTINTSDIQITMQDGTVVSEGVGYELVLENCDTPGKGTVTINGINYYGGTISYSVNVYGDLSDTSMTVITGVDSLYDYTGAAILCDPVVTFNGTVLSENVHYTVSYTGNDGVGTATVTIAAKDGSYYKNSQDVSFSIKYNLSTAVVAGIDSGYYFTGTQIMPTGFTVTCGTQMLVSGEQYQVVYGSNCYTGTKAGYVIISPASGASSTVYGSQTIYFDINTVSISPASNNSIIITWDGTEEATISDVTYTGSQIKPVPTIKLKTSSTSSITLEAGEDYTISYGENLNAGEGSVTITGYGSYSGTVTYTFTINQANLNNVDITVNNVYYAGGTALTPTMTLVYNGLSLTAGTDYTYELSNNYNVSTESLYGQVVISPGSNGNFAGSVTKTFSVLPNNIATGTIELETAEATYTGAIITPEITLVIKNGDTTVTLKEDEDYTITVSSGNSTIRNVGTYVITIDAMENSGYEGTRNVNFKVVAKELSSEDIVVSDIEDQDYTGSAVTPTVTVTDTGRLTDDSNDKTSVVLTLGTDYTITYSNNINGGAATDGDSAPTVTITGKGNYTGTITQTFNLGKSIEGATLNISQTEYTYDGSSHHPTVTSVVLDGGTTLSKSDYTEVVNTTVNYYVDAGSKVITVSGAGGYYGTITADFIIQPKNTDSIIIVINDLDEDDDGNYYTTYDGKEITPSVTVYDTAISTVVPVDDSEYTVTYEHNTEVSTEDSPAYVKVSFANATNYYGNVVNQAFYINAPDTDSTNFSMSLWANGELQTIWSYTGNAIKPDVLITFNNSLGEDIELTKDVDYTLTYTDNVKAGTATVTATLKGNFNGTLTKEFIIQADLATAKVAKIADQFYTGSAIYPAVTITCGGNTLVADEDYIASYYSNDGYSTSGKVIIVASPDTEYYIGETSASFSIVFDSSVLTISGVEDTYYYTGSPIMPDVVVTTPAGDVIKVDSLTYIDEDGGSDHTSVGTVTLGINITVGDDTTTLYDSFEIVERSVATCDIIYLQTMTYTGSALTPPVYLVYNGSNLVEDEDYVVSYSNNVNPTKGTITITGIGNYNGQTTVDFNIISANITSLTATPESTTSVYLTWNSRVVVTGFEVYSEDYTTKYGTTTDGTLSVTGLSPATEYTFQVRSYVTVDGTTTYGAFKSITSNTKVDSVTLATTSNTTGQVTLSWSTNDTVTGYEIYRSTSATSGFARIADVPATYSGYTDTSATSGTTYYYRIRGYKVFSSGNIQYGTYSKTISITAK